MEKREVIAINLHIGQFVEGTVASNISVDKYRVSLELTELGVLMKGKNTDALIPFSNLQAVMFRPLNDQR